MELIKNNPYRILGVLVGTKLTQIQRHSIKIPMYLEAGQEIPKQYSAYTFPVLGDLHQTIETINSASSKLNLEKDKMHAALFWFYMGNLITDEPAFDALAEDNHQGSIDIWIKLIDGNEINSRNCSAYYNLSTLFLCYSFTNSTINISFLEQGILLKIKYLESDFYNEIKSLATDETLKSSKKELISYFINSIGSEINKNGGITPIKFLEILKKQSFTGKDEILKGFIQRPIELVEERILETKEKRKADKSIGINVGKELFEQTHESLDLLKSILGISDLKFASISDKVSNEILQCGIDFFKQFQDSETDPGGASMDLFRKAKTLAIGNIAKQRCQENTENLQNWINNKPNRDKQKRIQVDLERLMSIIDDFDRRNDTIANAKQIIEGSISHLNNIKNILGRTDDLYLDCSTRIASDAQGKCVSEINGLQDRLSNTYDHATKYVIMMSLKEKVNEAWSVISTIGGMDVQQDFKNHYLKNRNSLSDLRAQLSNLGTNTGGGSGSSGCYIATMAYGSYNHPQVKILRRYRDEVLSNHFIGIWFIKFYHTYSPQLANILKNQKGLNIIIRRALNQIIKFLRL